MAALTVYSAVQFASFTQATHARYSMQGPSGFIWGAVTCQRTLQHTVLTGGAGVNPVIPNTII